MTITNGVEMRKTRKKKYDEAQTELFTLRMTPTLGDAVVAVADELDVSVATVVRISLEQFIHGRHQRLSIEEFMGEAQ